MQETAEKGILDIGPYLYDLRYDSVYVMAVTTNENDTMSVTLKDCDGINIGTFEINKGVRNTMGDYDSEYGERYTYNVLLPCLTANTAYIYDVSLCGAKFINNAFKTPPEPGDETTEFKLGIWGDTQDVPLCTKAAPEISAFRPLAVLHVGDFLNNGQKPGQLSKYLFGPAAELLRNSAIIPCAGNHDRGVSYWKNLFPTPRTNTSSYAGNLYYTYDIGNIHFVVIHLWLGLNKEYKELCLYNDDKDPAHGDAERVIKMLEEDAVSSAAEKAKYRIMTMHGPPISNPDWDKLLPYIKKYDPSILMFGHKHIYKYFTVSGTELKAIVTGLKWDGDTSYTNVSPSFIEATVNYYDADTGKYVLKLSPHVWDGSEDPKTGDFTFRPEDVIISPPEITAATVTDVSDTSAIITWDTDVPTDSRIDFGTDRYLDNSITVQGEFRNKHIVTLNNLIPGTTYFYRIKGKGTNGDIGRTDILEFRTKVIQENRPCESKSVTGEPCL